MERQSIRVFLFCLSSIVVLAFLQEVFSAVKRRIFRMCPV